MCAFFFYLVTAVKLKSSRNNGLGNKRIHMLTDGWTLSVQDFACVIQSIHVCVMDFATTHVINESE